MDELIEIEANNMVFGVDNYEREFKIQNLTINIVGFQIISPNPMIFQILPQTGSIDPCGDIVIKVNLKLFSSSNFRSYTNNTKLIVITQNFEDENDSWIYNVDKIQRNEVKIDFINSQNYQVQQISTSIMIAQKFNFQQFQEDEKKAAVNYIKEKYKAIEFTVTNQQIYINTVGENDVVFIQVNNQCYFLQIYVPLSIIHKKPKYDNEIMSPQRQAAPVKKKTIVVQNNDEKRRESKIDEELTHKMKSPTLIPEQGVEQQKESEQIKDQEQLNEIKPQQRTSQPKQENYKQRQYQSEIITNKDLSEFKQIKQSFLNNAPIQIEKSPKLESIQQQNIIQPNFKRVAIFNTYQVIKLVFLFKDNSYLLTVGDKDIIKVWSLTMNSEVGTIHDHNELKKAEILNMYEWPDINEKQFMTQGKDNVLRIFSVETMKLKQTIKIADFSELTSLAFMLDKDQLCLAGQPQPQFSITGSKYPKYRYLKFYNINTITEQYQFKIDVSENQVLSPIVYTDNENVHHARLNNMLVVCKTKKDQGLGELLLLLIDMDDKCNVILNLNFNQLGVYSVRNLYYLPLRGSFVLIERSDPKSYHQNVINFLSKKILVLNVKQLQTQNGLQSGIVCKQFDEPSIMDDEIYILPKMEYVIKVCGDIVHIIDLKSNQQQSIQISTQIGGTPRNVIIAGKIIRIDADIVQILELQS